MNIDNEIRTFCFIISMIEEANKLNAQTIAAIEKENLLVCSFGNNFIPSVIKFQWQSCNLILPFDDNVVHLLQNAYNGLLYQSYFMAMNQYTRNKGIYNKVLKENQELRKLE